MFVSVHRFSVPRSGLVLYLELAPMPENKGYRSEIRGFSSDFMNVRSKKLRALKNKPKVLIYALWPYHSENVEIFVKQITFERWTLNPWTVTYVLNGIWFRYRGVFFSFHVVTLMIIDYFYIEYAIFHKVKMLRTCKTFLNIPQRCFYRRGRVWFQAYWKGSRRLF